MPNNFKDFKRLAGEPFAWLHEDSPPQAYVGGQADLTPLRNRAREAIEALNDAQRAADAGRVDDAMEAIRRAKSAIDAALGGQMNPYNSTGGGGSYSSSGINGGSPIGR